MTLLRLRIVNLGPFVGEHVLDLAPAAGLIVLVGGTNGAGKSTLMLAIQLALFGDRLPKEKAVRDALLHRDASEAEIELVLRWDVQGAGREVTLARRWSRGARFLVSEVRADGDVDAGWTATWPERLETVYPLALLPLFAFDGELIRGLATAEQLPRTMASACESLLGLDLARQARAELRSAAERLRGSRADVEADQGRQAALDAAETECRAAHQAFAQADSELRDARAAWDTLDAELRAVGGDQAVRVEREREAGEARERVIHALQTLEEISAGLAPLLQAAPLLRRAIDRHATISPVSADARRWLVERDARILRQLASHGVAPETIRVVGELSAAELPLPASEEQIVALRALRAAGEAIPVERVTLAKGLASWKAAKQAMQAADARLAAMGAVTDPGDLPERRQRARAALDEAIRRCGAADAALAAAEGRRERARSFVAAQRSRAADASQYETSSLRGAAAADRVGAVLARYDEAVLGQRRSALEAAITRSFLTLYAKQNASHVRVDPESWRFGLEDLRGLPIDRTSMSAGEQQIFALALLEGLQRVCARRLPVLIDTPLGRLDQHARTVFLEQWLPERPGQVLLFSTDTEVSPAAAVALRAQGLLARAVTLVTEPLSGRSSITDGYFGSSP